MKHYHLLYASMAAALLAGTVSTFSQPATAQPAPAAAAARGGRAGGAALSIIQQLALNQMNVPAALNTAVTEAQTALNSAVFVVPSNPQAIRAASDRLAAAELAVAQTRATEFQKVQSSLEKITPEQAQAAGGGGGRGGGGGGGGRGGGAAILNWETSYTNHTGFVSLFDGTLKNWVGETDVWMINDGYIHSDNVNNSSGQHHIHYVGPGAVMRDFDLRVEFKIMGGNAGIHYRSRLLNGAHRPDNEAGTGTRTWAAALEDPLGKSLPAGITTMAQLQALPQYAGVTGNAWQISGYQFDITGNNTASLYEGQGRGVVANSGEMITLNPGGGRTVMRMVDLPYQQYGKPNDWNQAQVIARGNTLVHILNGHIFMVAVDDDPERRAMKGIISLQLEGTGQVWYRNVWVKNLDPAEPAKAQ